MNLKISDQELMRCVNGTYDLKVAAIHRLTRGADLNAAVYRVVKDDGKDYFLKLRRDGLGGASVTVPKYLNDHGLSAVIPPVLTKSNELCAPLGGVSAVLYPYIEGHNGAEAPLSDHQWVRFGAAIKQLHGMDIPQRLINDVRKEQFASPWPETVKTFLEGMAQEAAGPIAHELASFLESNSVRIHDMIKRQAILEALLKKRPFDYVLCHGDLHGWNLLVGKDDKLFVVDWDTLIFAPKERDLMFVGAGIHDTGRSAREEAALFYEGYGPVLVDHDAIAYYRLTRILHDMGEYCAHIGSPDGTDEERAQSLHYLKSNFSPGGTVDRASASNT